MRNRLAVDAVAVLAASAGLLGLPHGVASATASAATPSPSASSRHWHEDADHMGSGLPARTPSGTVPAVTDGSTAAATTVMLRGLDVSAFQETVDWSSVAANGASFAVVKATEGVNFTSSQFTQQYDGSAGVGLIRGAYHFALPDVSGGAAQADFFVAHGGGWRDDGKTLPGTLDIEGNPYGATCYGLSHAAMVSWINAFSSEYHTRTGRYPTIYTRQDWWSSCTGDNTTPGGHDPLWISNFNGSPTPLASGWSTFTFWQTADHGVFPGDQDQFNGTAADLRTLAHTTYTPPPPPPGNGWPTIGPGASGHRVTTLQYLLTAHGATLTVDGDFGPGTSNAVKAFQASKGLTADGIVGPNTWQALVVTVGQGDSGPAVKAVQDQLSAHGHPVTVDGVFGTGTSSAVKAFQASKGLTADGIVGPNTWQALLS